MASFLKNTWTALVSNYTADPGIQLMYWEEIRRSYTHPGRYYHNLNHIETMIRELAAVQQELEDPDSVLFAVYYHDIVYDPSSGDNEEKSAETAQQRMTRLNCSPGQIHKVGAQILATKSHVADLQPDTAFMLDADLCILGKDREIYKEYTLHIRNEYSRYPDTLYKTGRKKVLLRFLDSPQIFKTPHFYGLYEDNARENIQRELEEM